MAVHNAVDRDRFLAQLNALIANKREDNCFYFSQERYAKIISEVVAAKKHCSTPLHHRRLKRFDILEVDDEVKLIVPLKAAESNIQYYVANDELFNILTETHIRTNHGGRARMVKELQVKYKNVTYEVVMLYLNLCKRCRLKSNNKKSVATPIPKPKSITTIEFNSKILVDFIDMQPDKDGDYRFIMMYEEQLTKFIQLRPLKTKAVQEVANRLFEIFLTFGAPTMLNVNNNEEFTNEVILKICAKWKNVQIIYQNTQESGFEMCSQEIQNILLTWLNDNHIYKWSEGLPFAQFAKNTARHDDIGKSPYEALFGVKAKNGTDFLPTTAVELITSIKSEEEEFEESYTELEPTTSSNQQQYN